MCGRYHYAPLSMDLCASASVRRESRSCLAFVFAPHAACWTRASPYAVRRAMHVASRWRPTLNSLDPCASLRCAPSLCLVLYPTPLACWIRAPPYAVYQATRAVLRCRATLSLMDPSTSARREPRLTSHSLMDPRASARREPSLVSFSLMDPSASAHREPSPLNSMYLRAFMCCKPSYAFLSPMDPCTCVCREPSFIACWTHASACAMSEAVPAQLSADPSLIHGFLHADAWLIRFPAGGPSQLCFHFISALLQPSFGLASAIVAASLYSPQLRRSMRPGAWPLGGLYGLQHGALQLRHLCFGAPLLDDLRLYGLCGLHGPLLRPDAVCGSALNALRLDCSHDLQLAAVYDPPSGTPRLSGLRSSLLNTIQHCGLCGLQLSASMFDYSYSFQPGAFQPPDCLRLDASPVGSRCCPFRNTSQASCTPGWLDPSQPHFGSANPILRGPARFEKNGYHFSVSARRTQIR